jgi:ATP-dependent DNA helicase RecQ
MSPAHYDLESALPRFGLQSFRPGQREVISSIVDGDDCLCVMPTGGGKSLCYQLPSVFRQGLTIVVSPLIALMKDQVDSLGQRGIPAALINSTLSSGEQNERLQDVAAGKYQLVYVAPERLRNPRFLDAIRATPIQLLAIDEAHCISQWGHDFRPDYAKLGKFREWLGGVQTVALTATATPRVREDIVKVLGLKRPKQFMSGFARPNLHFGVVQRPTDREKDDELGGFLKTQTGSGIIYAATRKRCEAIVEWVSQKLKIQIGAYHAGLLPDQRRAIQERFMKNELRVIVATNAFGMGIDKPDLRFVVHYNIPGSLEAYYQEAGRAGRDGADSQCVLLYSYQDRYIQEFFIENNYPSREVIQQTYEFLLKREEDPIELTMEEIRDALGLQISPEAIGSALQVLSRTEVIDRLESGAGLACLRIDSNLPTLVELLPKEAKVRRKVLRVVERIIGDRRGEQVYLHPRTLLQACDMEREALNRTLRELCKLDEFDYVPPFRGRAVHFTRRDVPFAELGIDFENLRRRKEAEYDRLNQVVHYAQTPLCRQSTILNYFGDTSAENCGQCDRCCGQPGWPKFVVKIHPPTREQADTPEIAVTGTAEGEAAAEKTLAPTAPVPKAPQIAFLAQLIDAVERIHGRLGKILIAQYLSGSQNAKIQKLRLHRLSGFGMLEGSKQADVIELLELLLSNGLLLQQEVNRNRPTVAVAPQLADSKQRLALITAVQIPQPLLAKFIAKILKCGPAATPTNSQTGSTTQVRPASQDRPGQERPGQDRPSQDRQAAQTQADAVLPRPRPLPTPSVGDAAVTPRDTIRAVTPTPTPNAPPSQSRPAEEAKSPPPNAVDKSNSDVTVIEDWTWSVKLLRAGHRWEDVMSIRRMTDTELASSLIAALQQGEQVDRAWLAPADATGERTVGQQRVHRELQRRSAAGVR